jgi:hypothetical protein
LAKLESLSEPGRNVLSRRAAQGASPILVHSAACRSRSHRPGKTRPLVRRRIVDFTGIVPVLLDHAQPILRIPSVTNHPCARRQALLKRKRSGPHWNRPVGSSFRWHGYRNRSGFSFRQRFAPTKPDRCPDSTAPSGDGYSTAELRHNKHKCAPRCYEPAAALSHGATNRGGWVYPSPARATPLVPRAAHCRGRKLWAWRMGCPSP